MADAQATLQDAEILQRSPRAENPDENSTRAIYFHLEEGAPRFIWLKTETTQEDELLSLSLIMRPGLLFAINKEEEEGKEGIIKDRTMIRHNYALGR